ncbi:MAG TPA: ABC transporter permease [Gemmatimonadaceae bacterium]|nr:ABC transporter permease [Gemmatimonadaceae bacterium]
MTAMSTTLALPDLDRRTAVPRLFRLYVLETWYEFLKLLRQPHYIGGVVAFPVMFYLLFGLSLNRSGTGPKAAEYLLASYSVFGVVTAALFAFGVGVSTERASGWMLLKQAAPLPTPAYLCSKVVTCMLFGGVIVALLALLGVTAGGVRFSAGAWAGLFASVMLGCIPFCLFGLAVGYSIPPAGAPGIVNLLNLPLAFAGGLWMPHEVLPRPVQAIAQFVPQHHLGRLALSAVRLVPDPPGPHVAALGVATLMGLACATLAYRHNSR